MLKRVPSQDNYFIAFINRKGQFLQGEYNAPGMFCGRLKL